MRVVVIITVTTASVVLIGCSGGTYGATPTTSTSSRNASTSIAASAGPQLPDVVLQWLRHYNAHSSLARGTSADWVLTTHGKAATITSGAAPDDRTPVYLFDVHGSFVWHHRCPPGAPPSACTSTGSHEVFTVDPQRLQILDFGVQPHAPNLAQFGAVGVVKL